MSDLYEGINKYVRLVLVAAFVESPLDPALTRAELRDLVIQGGFAAPLFDEAWERSSRRSEAERDGKVRIESSDLVVFAVHGIHPRQIPWDAAEKVCQAFRPLNELLGAKEPKTVEMLCTQGHLPQKDVEGGLGLLIVYRAATRVEGGYTCTLSDTRGYRDLRTQNDASDTERRLEAVVQRVRTTLAVRQAKTVSSTPPITRFHQFLQKQGLLGLAGWWSMTSRELRLAEGHSATAATVLAASMLEAALVAIAEAAQLAGEWKRPFLQAETPDRWKLGQLIDQAAAAGTFSSNEAAHAKTLADLRNRIHVGKFAATGQDRFKPPFTNDHEAALAVRHLDLLVAKILDWAPIAALV